MKIQLISRDNGWGLSRDVRILKEALQGHEVTFTDWKRPKPRYKADINIFLELVNKQFFPQARLNWIMPNPEWFDPMWAKYQPQVDMVLAKTKDCRDIFSRHGWPVVYTGFTSEDRMDRSVPKEPKWVHLRGASSAKGTRQVIEAFAQMPDVPLLITTRMPLPYAIPENVTVRKGQMHDNDFRRLQNSSLFHLCPSTYEGFGHYANEARSCGCLVVSTDAAPMNEVSATAYVEATKGKMQNYHAQHYEPKVESIIEAVRAISAMNDKDIASERLKLREAFEADRLAFHNRLHALLAIA